MEIVSIIPRGYCQGVVRAIQIAQKTVKENPGVPVHMLGMIVHNRYVVEECRRLGIIVHEGNKSRLDLLDEIDEGIVIFTAHGVSDQVQSKAKEKGLQIVNATCLDVLKTHDIVKEHTMHGDDVIYIGKKNHPEAEGVVGLSEHIHLVSSLDDLEHLNHLQNVLITNQTTLSVLDTKDLIEACVKKYPNAIVKSEICNATTVRQEAVMNHSDLDVLIVVGDPHSNNSNQLKEIATKAGIPESFLIEDITQLKENMIAGKEKIGVTSGSSTPNAITKQIIDFLKQYAVDRKFIIPQEIHPEIL